MLDLLTIAVIAVFVFIGFKKGVARTALSFVSKMLSLMISILLSKPIAESFYESSIKPSLISKIDSAIKTAAQTQKQNVLDEIIKTFPSFIRNSIPNFDITNQTLNHAITKGSNAVEGVLRPVIISFATLIISIILFLAISITAKIIINIVCDKMDVVTKGMVDSFFGSLVGLIEGFIVIIAAAFILRIALPHMQEPPQLFSDESITQSYVFKGIYDSDILREIIVNTTNSPNTREL